MTLPFDPETAENNPDIEKQWAVKAFDHAEVYMKLLRAVDSARLKLTRMDDDIYNDFKKDFPDFQLDIVDEEALKSKEAKEKWRPWIMKYEKLIADYNFGTLLRLRADGDYTEENTIFATRMQFYAIEIARNREGLNKAVSQ